MYPKIVHSYLEKHGILTCWIREICTPSTKREQKFEWKRLYHCKDMLLVRKFKPHKGDFAGNEHNYADQLLIFLWHVIE